MLSASKTSAPSASGYNINNSLRFRSSASGNLSRTPASAGNRQTWTLSVWLKRGNLGSQNVIFGAHPSDIAFMGFYSDNTFYYDVQPSTTRYRRTTAAVFRDPSAWYHVVFVADTTNATNTERLKVYINNVQYPFSTDLTATGYIPQNTQLNWNDNVIHRISAYGSGSALFFDGYLADFNFIDGQALTPSSFGETNTTTGVWKPKAYSGTYGTNGFYLKFSDIATTSGSNAGLGKDFSGNSNYWTTNNISVTAGTTYDAMTDSPTLTSATVANYATLNYIDTNTASSISGANLNWVDAGGIDREIRGTIGVSSGKYYWEVVLTSSNTSHVGVDTLNSTLLTDYLGSTSTSWSIYLATGNKRNAGSNTSYGSSLAANDIMMCALDMDNGKIWWGKNGTWFASGDPAAGTNAAFTNLSGYTIAFAATPRSSCSVNFGQRPFSYTPPTGFNRLNTYNLSDSTIKKGNSYMDATLYTGTLATLSINNNAGFSPSLVWIKSRSAAGNTNVYDAVRGATLELETNFTNAEATVSNGLTSFNSNGFTLGNNAGVNTSGTTYVAWQWQAGSSTVTNTSGSISSQVRVNTTAGFSVVTYTGTGANATVGHGLGVAPKMIIFKVRNTTNDWAVYHGALATPATQALFLNLTNAVATTTTAWNSTAPTSSVFSVGTTAIVNGNTNTYVAYCFAEIAGFSKFGSYTGNGSADGPFVYTGFRPKYIMIKNSSAAYSWYVEDTSRATYNAAGATLAPNTSAAEDTAWGSGQMDILSNGFKIRISSAESNANGNTFIYAAFAENPFKNALAR